MSRDNVLSVVGYLKGKQLKAGENLGRLDRKVAFISGAGQGPRRRRGSLGAEDYFATIGDDVFPFPGWIDEVAVYNRALLAYEIKNFLDAGKP